MNRALLHPAPMFQIQRDWSPDSDTALTSGRHPALELLPGCGTPPGHYNR